MLFDATKRDITVKSYYVSVYNISFTQGCGNNVTGATTAASTIRECESFQQQLHQQRQQQQHKQQEQQQ